MKSLHRAPKLFCLSLLFLLALIASAPAYAQGGNIRNVDFRNFTYRPDCAYDGKPVRVRRGRYERNRGDDKVFFNVRKAVYGDLTGDGRDEAIIISHCNTGGTGQFTGGYIYTMRRGRPVEIARLEEGDRAFGGIHDVRVERGLLMVERYAPQEPGVAACCPKYIDTTTYRLSGGRLSQVGREQRRDAPQQ